MIKEQSPSLVFRLYLFCSFKFGRIQNELMSKWAIARYTPTPEKMDIQSWEVLFIVLSCSIPENTLVETEKWKAGYSRKYWIVRSVT